MALRNKSISPKYDFSKSDVFSFGITMLGALTLTNGDMCYNWDECSID